MASSATPKPTQKKTEIYVYMVKKNLFTTSQQSQEQVDLLLLSKSTVKRCKNLRIRAFTLRCRLVRKTRLDFPKKHQKKPAEFWERNHWTNETKMNFYQNDGRRKVCRRKGTAHHRSVPHYLSNMVEALLWYTAKATQEFLQAKRMVKSVTWS